MLMPIKPKIVPKAWGQEVWIHNCPLYCGKLLQFKPGGEFSFHYHIDKTETWCVLKGTFILKSMDTVKAHYVTTTIGPGTVIHVPRGEPHQLWTSLGGEIMEVSTQHFDEDSYRIHAGDSQK